MSEDCDHIVKMYALGTAKTWTFLLLMKSGLALQIAKDEKAFYRPTYCPECGEKLDAN